MLLHPGLGVGYLSPLLPVSVVWKCPSPQKAEGVNAELGACLGFAQGKPQGAEEWEHGHAGAGDQHR